MEVVKHDARVHWASLVKVEGSERVDTEEGMAGCTKIVEGGGDGVVVGFVKREEAKGFVFCRKVLVEGGSVRAAFDRERDPIGGG